MAGPALAFATDDPGDALEALELVREEVGRRLRLLRSLPGAVCKVTPELAAEHELPLWLLAIDELAFHTSAHGRTRTRRQIPTITSTIRKDAS